MIEFLQGMESLLLYYIVLVIAMLLLHKLVKVPDELFRKLLHLILLGSLPVVVYCFPTWQMAALASLGFAAVVYPALHLLERWRGYAALLRQRKTGEIKQSLLLVFFMFASIIAVCWGWLNDRALVLACIYAWGFGDAFAALIGKRYGKHHITGPRLNGKKTYEGSLSMFLVSLASVLIILLLRGGLAWYACVVIAAATAAATTVVELYTTDGRDTLYCPFSAAAVLLPLVYLFGGLV